MKKIQLKDFEIDQIKEDSDSILKNNYRVLEFATESHHTFKGVVYGYFDHEQEALDHAEENKHDSETHIEIMKCSEISKIINEFNELII